MAKTHKRQILWQQYSFDQSLPNAERLYVVFKNQSANGEIRTKAFAPEPLAATLKKDYPEVEQVARTNALGNSLLTYGSKAIKFNTIAADSTFPGLFSFGASPAALAGETSIVLTRSAATALFGAGDPMGKTITFNNEFPLVVSAVINDHPANSSFSFNAMISWRAYEHQRPWMKDAGWDGRYIAAI